MRGTRPKRDEAREPEHLDATKLMALIVGREFSRALTVLDEGLADVPDEDRRLYLRARALSGLGRKQEAAALCEQVIALRPDYQEAWWLLVSTSQHFAAPETFQSLLKGYAERFPDDAEAHRIIGQHLIENEEWSRAEDHLRRAIAFDPGDQSAFYGAMVAQAAQGRLDDAAATLASGRAARRQWDERRASSLNSAGLEQARVGDWNQAQRTFQAAIAAHIECDAAHYNRGAALHSLGLIAEPPRPVLPEGFAKARDVFHAAFYHPYSNIRWKTMRCAWQGHDVQKFAEDLITYQEILFETRPTLIVECGTFMGGSALFYANVLDLIGDGRIVSIDTVEIATRPSHLRITYLRGSSSDPQVLHAVEAVVQPGDRIMVILDSDHSSNHVRAELRAFAGLVTPGCYLVVEDSNIDLSPVTNPNYVNGGPLVAIAEFIADHGEFYVDRNRERFMLTVAPYGFLLRLAHDPAIDPAGALAPS
jgi:cephalosporin hydroxylase